MRPPSVLQHNTLSDLFKFFCLVIVTCQLSLNSSAQVRFQLNDTIPVTEYGHLLPNAWAGGINYPLWSEIDLNGDGLKDLFMIDRSNYRVITMLNDGTSGTGAYHYAPQYASLFPPLRDWAWLYDYNCDGRPDLFTNSSNNSGIIQYRNDSTAAGIVFTVVDSLIQFNYGSGMHTNIAASNSGVPWFVDMDNDGDMDILTVQYTCNGTYAYYRNYSMEHYGTCDSLDDYRLVTNSWGNFKLLSGAFQYVSVEAFGVVCPVADAEPQRIEKPSSLEWRPEESARRDDSISNIIALDLDGDGDKDALIGDSGAINVLEVTNGGTADSAQMVSQEILFPGYDTPVQIHSFATCSYVDVDNDGKKDLVVGNREFEDKHGVLFYKNNGTNDAPVFNYQNDSLFQSTMIDVGEGAAPVFFDADADSLQDIVIGNYLITGDSTSATSLTLYKNTGTATAPSFQLVTNDYAAVSALNIIGPLYPAFGDLDGDGDADMLLGGQDGRLNYFTNNAPVGSPANFVFTATYYDSIDVGNNSTPQIVDLNHDGLLDLVVGAKNGLIKYFQNTGTSTAPAFSRIPTIDTLGRILLRPPFSSDAYSVPFVFKDSGEYKLLVSDMQGDVLLYDHLDGNLTGTFDFVDTMLSKTLGSRSAPNVTVSGADVDGDGKTDMLIGLWGGGIQIYCRNHTTGITSSAVPQPALTLLPNPATDHVLIKTDKALMPGHWRIAISDVTGRTVYSAIFNPQQPMLSTKGLSAGLYMLTLRSEAALCTARLVIAR